MAASCIECRAAYTRGWDNVAKTPKDTEHGSYDSDAWIGLFYQVVKPLVMLHNLSDFL